MSSTLRLRNFLRDLSVTRLWSVWTRGYILNTVVKRCRKERRVREVFHCIRQTFLRPRRTFLISATAAYTKHDHGDSSDARDSDISDDDLKAVVEDLDNVEELSRATLFCKNCNKRLVIDKKQNGVVYCMCSSSAPLQGDVDGWAPYMEADDVIIWRKEYKPGQGLYAYKIYGRYGEVVASDFAAVQVDCRYRRAWDAAVAALSVVDRAADRTVLHWEVLWPRLFANRDYVYLRRHKVFDVKSKSCHHKDQLFSTASASTPSVVNIEERPSVHSNAKRKAIERDIIEGGTAKVTDNKVYVIVSRSCTHNKVPETRHAIRVTEYWSDMVVKSLDGPEQPGMEFVLTYYDEPAVGGMPQSVAAWASGRAAPQYLRTMRRAAHRYRQYSAQEMVDFSPLDPESEASERDADADPVSEEDMESSKRGPEMNEMSEEDDEPPREEDEGGAAAEASPPAPPSPPPSAVRVAQVAHEFAVTADKSTQTEDDDAAAAPASKEESPEEAEDKPETNAGWWRLALFEEWLNLFKE